MRTLKRGFSGSDVMKIQSVLKKAGYYSGNIEGIFDNKTHEAVLKFQKKFKLNCDGIIEEETWEYLAKYILGFDIYRTSKKDDLDVIAKKYLTSSRSILIANPGINFKYLKDGREILIPFNIDVVDTDVDYSYEIMEWDIQGLRARYPFLEVGIAGKSALDKNLYYLRIGRGPREIFYCGAHRASDWITSVLLMKFCEKFLRAYIHDENIMGYNISDIFEESSIYVLPMVNPDGVDLTINGLSPLNPLKDLLVNLNNGSKVFLGNWQANIRGVELDLNYNLQRNSLDEFSQKGEPGPSGYSGKYPESEPETKALVSFTRIHNFRQSIVYKCGENRLYCNLNNEVPKQTIRIGEMFSQISGYSLPEKDNLRLPSGYMAWFVERYGNPCFTVEVGNKDLSIKNFSEIYKKNVEIMLLGAVI